MSFKNWTNLEKDVNEYLSMGSRKRRLQYKFSSKKSARWFKQRVVHFGAVREQEPHDSYQIDPDTQVDFCDNTIRSAKYTIFSFWFLNLFEQFRRVANFYFLIVAVVQLCLPSPPVSPFTSVFPLVFVVVVTMIKQGYEDICRHRSDREINMAPVTTLVNSNIKNIKSKDIKVGDIVLVKINETFPADLVLLSTPSPSGKGYVMTANLDGETNLKPVFASKLTKHCKTHEELSSLAGQIECESPNPNLNNFTGRLKLGHQLTSLSLENLVMRGTKLRNTEYVYGCAVYTGRDTKMSRNSKITANKFSTVEKTMNKFLLFFMALLVFEIVFSTSMKYIVGIDVQEKSDEDLKHWYLGSVLKVSALKVTEDFFSYLVIYNYIIPISLYVTLEFQKFVGSLFLVWDKDLVDSSTGEGPKCNSSDLNEELGQIEVLFSDKTGTLTENIMIFKEASIKGRKYKYEDLLPGSISDDKDSSFTVNTEDSLFDSNGSYRDPMDENDIIEFLRALALCHTVQVGRTADQPIKTITQTSSRLQIRKPNLKFLTPLRMRGRSKSQEASLVTQDGQLPVTPTDSHLAVTPTDGHLPVTPTDSYNQYLPVTPTEGSVFNGDMVEIPLDDQASSARLVAGGGSSRPVSQVDGGSQLGVDNAGFDDDENEIIYNAASPDEKALVEACLKFGVGFAGEIETGANNSVVVKETRSGSSWKKVYEKLQVLEFDSTRKRMSVILRNCANNEIVVYTKGAESSVIPRCADGPFMETNRHIDEYALVGLRTLAVATRSLSEDEYQHFQHKINEAAQSLEARSSKIRAVYDEIENDMMLLGATAVEDKLQDGVKDTLVKLTCAGISVWILTGDKKETAVNISYSCGHLQPEQKVLDLTGQNSLNIHHTMSLHLDQIQTSEDDNFALLVDGSALALILPHKELKETFFDVSIKCKSVICCRMSPLQKSEVVTMVKNSAMAPITAAIGDGGNDVAMIQEAHVGLGIMGKEGRAAVRAADFAFPKFKHLQKVVLVHGHWYYYRVSLLVQYFFYKNVACFSCQQYYAIFNSFSTQTLFDSVSLTLYNICYTSLPIFLFSLMEKNLEKKELLDIPGHYRRHFRNRLLRWREFFLWFSQALWHSLVFFFGWLFFWSDLKYGGLNLSRELSLDRVSFGTATYASIVTLVNLRLLFQSRSWNIYLVLSIIGSVLFYVVFNFTLHSISIPLSWASFFLDYDLDESSGLSSVPAISDTYWVYHHVLSSAGVWMFTILLLIVAIMPDVVIRIFRKHWASLSQGHSKRKKEKSGVYTLSYVNKGYSGDNLYLDSQGNMISQDQMTATKL